MTEKLDSFLDTIFHISLLIYAFQNITLSNASPFFDLSLLDTDSGIQQVYRSELRFMDKEKIDKIMKFELPLVIEVVIVDRALIILLVDDKSSYNVLYKDALWLLNLKLTDIDPFGGEDLLAFNDLVTQPYGAIYMTLSIDWRDS